MSPIACTATAAGLALQHPLAVQIVDIAQRCIGRRLCELRSFNLAGLGKIVYEGRNHGLRVDQSPALACIESASLSGGEQAQGAQPASLDLIGIAADFVLGEHGQHSPHILRSM